MKSVEKIAEDVFRRRDAYEREKKRRRRAASAVSCFGLVLVLGVLAWRYSGAPEIPLDEQQPVTWADVSVPESVRKRPAEDPPRESEGHPDRTEEEPGETESPSAPARPQGPLPDAGGLVPLDRGWGGSYEEKGVWVICLTEDTPENRQEVFERNPDLSEENTRFRAVDYTLEYLQDLLERLSRTELPACVSSVGLELDRNRVGIFLKEADPDGMAEVQAYDSSGGALRFVVLSAPQVPYEAVKGPQP